ncbi:phosphate/phosphite/phosphonate ABC transporter substrate-binding protein [Geomonas sp. RF6]|uniref:phosphate/phosphite/phosphonate ABC transporter substrate-binding protein n=1 Tax=Geomonas sp. RF6 TaxID=2897342 RepID=UPI001E5B0630|nr:phosphate/phosphite/phosphonate ABC transporter substrate-binding protein [Geomonas sp. RF6]UFS69303.1 phosphate/phosphite/phosphonate ABC transporter substrate-binding protein [Geomonas sp. RF6]
MSRTVRKFLLILFFLCFPLVSEGKVFSLGIISDKPVEKKVEGYAPLARYVAAHLSAQGVTGGRVVVAGSLEEMLRMIARREVDVVLESPFWTLRMQEKGGMKPTLLVWKHGKKEYRTVFFVRKDSGLTRLEDLKRKVLALQDPGSTSAFLIPAAELRRQGMRMAPAKGKADPSAVRYVLVGHEKNQVFWVTEKKADAAAFGSDDWEDVAAPEKEQLKVIHTSRPFLRYVASFHPALKPGLRKAIVDVLVQMDRDPQGQKVLQKASGIRKMEPLSATDRESLRFIREQMQK